MPATIPRRLISIGDAADALAVSTRTVRRYIADGQLQAVRLGRKTLRIKVDSIERSSTRGRSAADDEQSPRKGQERPSLAAHCSSYVPSVSAETWWAILGLGPCVAARRRAVVPTVATRGECAALRGRTNPDRQEPTMTDTDQTTFRSATSS